MDSIGRVLGISCVGSLFYTKGFLKQFLPFLQVFVNGFLSFLFGLFV